MPLGPAVAVAVTYCVPAGRRGIGRSRQAHRRRDVVDVDRPGRRARRARRVGGGVGQRDRPGAVGVGGGVDAGVNL